MVALIYNNLGNINMKNNNIDEGVKYFRKSLQIYIKLEKRNSYIKGLR